MLGLDRMLSRGTIPHDVRFLLSILAFFGHGQLNGLLVILTALLKFSPVSCRPSGFLMLDLVAFGAHAENSEVISFSGRKISLPNGIPSVFVPLETGVLRLESLPVLTVDSQFFTRRKEYSYRVHLLLYFV